MIIWGNHSPTMYPDFENALKDNQSVANLIEDTNWIDSHFIPNVQQRGKAVIDARGASSATSAAKAALDTVIACENPTSSDDCFSAAVYSDGAYDVPEGIMCGFPLMTTPSGEIEIIRDLTLSDNARSRLNLSVDELLSERGRKRSFVKSFLTSKFIKYIQGIIIDEKLSEIAIITGANISKLVDNISGNFDSLNVYNKINDFCGSAEIYFIFSRCKFYL